MEKHFWGFIAGFVFGLVCLAVIDHLVDTADQFVRGMSLAFGFTFGWCYVAFKLWKK